MARNPLVDRRGAALLLPDDVAKNLAIFCKAVMQYPRRACTTTGPVVDTSDTNIVGLAGQRPVARVPYRTVAIHALACSKQSIVCVYLTNEWRKMRV